MIIKTNIAEGVGHKGGITGTPVTPQPQETPSLYPSDGRLVYTAIDRGRCIDCVELRKMLKVAGKMAFVVRRLVGGVENSTGYKKPPIRITDLDGTLEGLRELVDEYDKAVLEDCKKVRCRNEDS